MPRGYPKNKNVKLYKGDPHQMEPLAPISSIDSLMHLVNSYQFDWIEMDVRLYQDGQKIREFTRKEGRRHP